MRPKSKSKVVEWRRDIHRNPELGNREFETAAKVAAHLESLAIAVQTGVAHTGVVGLLEGGRPGPVVALRADMDALPVTEQVDLPFASTVRSTYNGQEVGVMHACGHDNHVAILMGVAEVLAGMRDRLPGSVKFIFQPAEEGPPEGEDGGAAMMLREGVFENPRPDVIFGLHVGNDTLGRISYRPGGAMASADRFRITVHGRQTHGARPWGRSRSYCGRFADNRGTADDFQPPGECHGSRFGDHDWNDSRRVALQTSSPTTWRWWARYGRSTVRCSRTFTRGSGGRQP